MSEIKTNLILPAFRARALSRVMGYVRKVASIFFRAIQIVRLIIYTSSGKRRVTSRNQYLNQS